MLPVEIKVGFKLMRLLPPDVIAVAERGWQADRANLVQSLNDSGANDEIRVERLTKHDRTRGTRLPAVFYAYTITGATDIIALACKAQNVDLALMLADLDDERIVECALQLLNVDMSRKEPKAPNSGE